MKFSYLVDRKVEIPKLARWYYDEWGANLKDSSLESISSNLQAYLNKNEVPLIILAIEGNETIGAAQLKFREMSIYPEKEYWLGGVYVDAKYRGKSVAKALINKVEEIAISIGIPTLHLQTENLTGGIYAALGWCAIEQVNYRDIDVLVMYKDLPST